ncbi:hypothetical protein [Streptomyces alboflavus]|uniref:hypothetical protein n=1 Tax=Streptomyces alboflavus TaxID=67267 RepID=UPI000F6576FA|nr:hypothetical protein [Streptomyces alboflavus]
MQVPVSHHQFVLLDTDAEAPEESIDDTRAGNGLVTVNAAGTYASVMTGTPHGDLEVTFDVRDSEPPLDTDSWDETVDISMYFSGQGPLAGDPVPDDLLDVPLLGDDEHYQWWRFRFHARGRDTAHAPDGPPEEHLVQAWPAPRAPEVRHKLTDQTGHRRRNPDPDHYARTKAAEAAAADTDGR